MQRAFVNLLCADVARTARFYEACFGLARQFDSDWFVLFGSDDVAGFEFGLLQRDHETVPEALRDAPRGLVATFVVDDCETTFARALELGAEALEPPHDTPYGQRRALVRDPEGAVVDISAPTAPRSS